MRLLRILSYKAVDHPHDYTCYIPLTVETKNLDWVLNPGVKVNFWDLGILPV